MLSTTNYMKQLLLSYNISLQCSFKRRTADCLKPRTSPALIVNPNFARWLISHLELNVLSSSTPKPSGTRQSTAVSFATSTIYCSKVSCCNFTGIKYDRTTWSSSGTHSIPLSKLAFSAIAGYFSFDFANSLITALLILAAVVIMSYFVSSYFSFSWLYSLPFL